MKNTFEKSERICSKKTINALFSSSSGFYEYPFRIIYKIVEKKENSIQILITVPKKNIKKIILSLQRLENDYS